MRLPRRDASRAVLIGTSTFTHLTDLPAVRNNLRDLAAALTSDRGAGLDEERCTVLPDPDSLGALGAHLQEAAAQAQDMLLVYYAGHGLVDPKSGHLYLSLPETQRDLLKFTALPFSHISEIISNSTARNRVMILDCCFSGRALAAMGEQESVVTGQIEIDGSYTLASAPANTPSTAPEGAEHTTFTGELLALLRDGIADEPHLLTLDSLYRGLRRVLVSRGMPPPQRLGTQTSDMLALAPNPAYAPPEPEPAPEPVVEADTTTPQQWYEQGARNGDTDAMFKYAIILGERGRKAEASSWLLQAATAHHPDAMLRLAQKFWAEGEPAEAESWYREAAEDGLPEAMFNLGILLRAQNRDGEAMPWFERAAAAGSTGAMYHLGALHEENGSPTEAEEWYRQAAADGDDDAILHLGIVEGRRGNVAQALRWFHRAEASGHIPEQEMTKLRQQLSRIDARTDTAQKANDRARAVAGFAASLRTSRAETRNSRQFRDAADAGDADASAELGRLAEQAGQLREAEFHYRGAAAKGSVKGIFALGLFLHERGQQQEAEQWYRSAAKLGHARAMNNLGVLCQDDERIQEARGWYELAANRGEAVATFNLGVLAEDEGDAAEARSWYLRAADDDVEAAFRLGVLAEAGGERVAALKQYKRAADRGHVESMYRLGIMFTGWDREEAERCHRRALRNGHPEAATALVRLRKERSRLSRAVARRATAPEGDRHEPAVVPPRATRRMAR
ncbi:tetratricopeptide repeat protein [Saccharopolyspora hirsuta]|uniref:caspase, EACC1-associated type n=1 Tax=Saccharopolyspora hirsuta TaxID=1837 RepID=UPI00331DBDF2